MATPNYSYEKRQRELAKKRKAEEKRQRKLHGKPASGDADGADSDVTDTAPGEAANNGGSESSNAEPQT